MGSTAKEGGGDQEVFVLTWNDFHTQFVSSFQEMRGEGDFLDTTVACSSGDQLKAHKVVLSASSPFFKSLLKNNPSPHPTLVMSSEVKFQVLRITCYIKFSNLLHPQYFEAFSYPLRTW